MIGVEATHHARFIIDHGVIHDRVTGKHVRTALNENEDGVEECCALLNSLADACLHDGLPTFEEAWAEKVAAGYQYGEDALMGVRFGWKIRSEVERRAKKAHLFKTAERLAKARAEIGRLRAALQKVPIARMRKDFMGLDCIGCGAGPESNCKEDCWALGVDRALNAEPATELHGITESGGGPKGTRT